MTRPTYRRSLRAHILNNTPMPQEDEAKRWTYLWVLLIGCFVGGMIVYLAAVPR